MDEFVNSQSYDFATSFFSIDLFSNVAFALIILLAGFAVGKLVGIALFKLLKGIEFNKGLKKFAIMDFDVSRSIGSFVSWIIYILSVIVALSSLNIFYEVLWGLFYFVVLILLGSSILGFFFALPNFFASFYIKKKGLVKEGDLVSVSTVKGELVHVGFFNTRIRGFNNELFLVPNKLVKKKIKVIKN